LELLVKWWDVPQILGENWTAEASIGCSPTFAQLFASRNDPAKKVVAGSG
jgi:hypothetical protein